MYKKDLWKNGKNIPEENNSERNSVFPTRLGEKKMIEETSLPLFLLCTSSLIATFAYYNIKYRKFIKEQAA
jgi:hypothetical protein